MAPSFVRHVEARGGAAVFRYAKGQSTVRFRPTSMDVGRRDAPVATLQAWKGIERCASSYTDRAVSCTKPHKPIHTIPDQLSCSCAQHMPHAGLTRRPSAGLKWTLSFERGDDGREAALCLLEHLQVLDVGHNELSGQLPQTAECLPELRTLDVRDNHIGGDIPQWLVSLVEDSRLEKLVISENNFDYPSSETEVERWAPLISRCQGRNLRCAGLPPQSCSSFGPNFKPKTNDPDRDSRCTRTRNRTLASPPI
eukprot:6653659-Prymnesium_polylepis.1